MMGQQTMLKRKGGKYYHVRWAFGLVPLYHSVKYCQILTSLKPSKVTIFESKFCKAETVNLGHFLVDWTISAELLAEELHIFTKDAGGALHCIVRLHHCSRCV